MTERDSSRLAAFHTTCLRRIMSQSVLAQQNSQYQTPSSDQARTNGHRPEAKMMEMVWSHPADGCRCVCTNCIDLGSRGNKKEGKATYHLEEDYLRGIEESWHSLGGSRMIGKGQSSLEGPH